MPPFAGVFRFYPACRVLESPKVEHLTGFKPVGSSLEE